MLCEKPLANTVRRPGDGRGGPRGGPTGSARWSASTTGGSRRGAGPAVGVGGPARWIRHVRAQYLQDWIVDPEFPLVWRLQKEQAGSGALGDIGAHIVDLTQYVTGQRLSGVNATLETFVTQRPLPGPRGLSASGEDGVTGQAPEVGDGHGRRRRGLPRPG